MSATGTLDIAKVCNSIINRETVKGSNDDLLLARKLYIAYQVLGDIVADDPTSDDLDLINAYTLSLCGGYAFEAEGLLLGGSGVVVNPVLGDTATLSAFNIQFTVGSGGMLAGETSYIVTYPYIMVDSITVEMPQSNLPVDDPNQLSYQIAYTNTNATITFLNGTPNIGVQDGMQFLIKGLRFVSIEASGGGSPATVVATDWHWENIAVSGATVYIPTLLNKTIQVAFRAMPTQVITSGTPIGNQVLWDSATAIMTAPASNPFVATEQLTIEYEV